MNLKIFGSMGFAICAFTYLILILLMHLNKRKTGDVQTKVFAALLSTAIVITISEVAYVYGLSIIDTNPKLAEITCRIYLAGNLLWINILLFYLMTIFEKNDNKEVEKRHNLITLIILAVLFSIIAAISISLPLDYTNTKSNFYNFAGPATTIVYIAGIVLFIVICIVLFLKADSIPTNQKKVMYFTLILFIIFTFPQLLFEYDYNTTSFMFAYMTATLYFTIESQDSKLIKELQYSKEEASIADKAKTEFLINMSHEIRTPMSTILGYSDVLLNEKSLTEEVAKRDTENIYKASNILMELIDAILDISSLESNQETIKNEPYNIKKLLANIEEEIIAKIDSDVEFIAKKNSDMVEQYIGDSEKIKKILNNIINYIVKVTPSGKINLSVESKKVDKNTHQILFNINSNNCIINPEKFNIEFNDFVKLGENKDNSINNDDLKLIIAKRYINLLNGRIVFKNNNNHCECTILLVQNISNEEQTSTIVEKEKPSSNKKVLIIDNNKVNHIIISKLLEEYHFNISNAYTEEEYNNKVTFEKYDLIFIDTSFIDETLEQSIKSINMNSTIIEMNENRTDKKTAYINDIIYKPVSKDSINTIVHKYIKNEKDVSI